MDLIKTLMDLQLDGEPDRRKCTCSFESRPFKLVATIDSCPRGYQHIEYNLTRHHTEKIKIFLT
jgi:hypothetical protein